ncbi:tRNA-dihydrouridine synthase 3 [Saitoella coloradoensis]
MSDQTEADVLAEYYKSKPGYARIKKEYLLPRPESTPVTTPAADAAAAAAATVTAPEDASERDSTKNYVTHPDPAGSPAPAPAPASDARDARDGPNGNKKRKRGQNKNRKFNNPGESGIKLCSNTALNKPCPFGTSCKFTHSIPTYLASKPPDISSTCPVFTSTGRCDAGWKCRFLSGHVEKPVEDDSSTWKLVVDEERARAHEGDYLNVVGRDAQKALRTHQMKLPKSEVYMTELEKEIEEAKRADAARAKINQPENAIIDDVQQQPSSTTTTNGPTPTDLADQRATYLESRYRPQEKHRLTLSGAKILAPLTTVGNIPFRRICKSFGADVTVSEMGLSAPLLQGHQPEWALPRAHTTERTGGGRYGVQIAGGKIRNNVQAAEALSTLCNDIDFIDLNSGCPIDLVYHQGAGSALLDTPLKLLRMARGMSQVSAQIPITVKIRTGTKDGHPTALNLIKRLREETLGGVQAVTLHGRSRQQRYTRSADWDYIKSCAEMVAAARAAEAASDIRGLEAEEGEFAPMAFVGNGDIYTFEDWHNALGTGVDAAMIARGALIKPWIFEEIEKGQHIDKTPTQRLDVLRDFANYGLEYWGADAHGIATTRRFLCESMSFMHRYIPVSVLEEGWKPSMRERAPRWKARDGVEEMLGSGNCGDWVKLSEMFLGPVGEGWEFVPKHKSNSVEGEEAQG